MGLSSCHRTLNFPTQNKKICGPAEQEVLDFNDLSLYQVGDQWDRVTMEDPKDLAYQTLLLSRTGMGPIGTGVYLGVFGDKHIVMTAAHVYPELSSCSEEVNFLFKHNGLRFYVTCSGWSYKLKDNDVMFFAIQTENPEHLNFFKPVSFDTKHIAGESLNLVGVTRDYNYDYSWNIDDQKDCRLLSSTQKIVIDPDCGVYPGTPTQSWSLPIGCDGKHGDSGAPIFNKDLKLKGLLWTGKFPKQNQSSSQLLNDLQYQSERIWTDYNYIVPISSVEKEIDHILENTFHLSEETRSILESISHQIKIDAENEL